MRKQTIIVRVLRPSGGESESWLVSSRHGEFSRSMQHTDIPRAVRQQAAISGQTFVQAVVADGQIVFGRSAAPRETW